MIKPNHIDPTSHENDEKEHDDDSGRGKPWLALLVIAILAGVVAWFWLARDPESREELTQRIKNLSSVTENVTSTLQGMASSAQNMLSSLRDRVTGKPPAPNVGGTAGSSLPGAPPKTHAPIETAEDLERALAEQGPAQEGGASERGMMAKLDEQTIPPEGGRKDDAVVRLTFIDDLASWLVTQYAPAPAQGRTGQVTASLQSANLRYGVGMKGLAWIGEDLPAGRSAALEYVYTPAMLDALYRLYITRFMDAVHVTLNTRPDKGTVFSKEQKDDFYKSYARRFRGISGALQGVAALPDFPRQMHELKRAAQQVIDANAHYSELVFAYDEAREQGNTAKAEPLRQRMDSASHSYRQAVLAREQSREAFAQLVKKNQAARALDDESLLYIASWVERRTHKAPDKMDATLQAATLFLDLAQHFEAAERAVLTGGAPTQAVQAVQPALQSPQPMQPRQPQTHQPVRQTMQPMQPRQPARVPSSQPGAHPAEAKTGTVRLPMSAPAQPSSPPAP